MNKLEEMTRPLYAELLSLSESMQESLVKNDANKYHHYIFQSNVVFECINHLEEAYK